MAINVWSVALMQLYSHIWWECNHDQFWFAGWNISRHQSLHIRSCWI